MANAEQTPRSRHLKCLGPHGFHRLHYLEWGDPGSPEVVVCAHGLTRNAHDFDDLAERLGRERRVLCVDVPGRGGSERLSHPLDYGYPLYCQDLAAVIARADVAAVDWVGTSMGGLIGMMLAAQPGTPVRRLVLNDVGPFLPAAALQRIADYVGRTPDFPDLAALETYLRQVHAPFGPLSDAQWRRFASHSAVQGEDGRWRLGYDPAIAEAFRAAPLEDVDLWPVWEAVRCPTLLLRGAESDVLDADTAQEMTRRGPRATLVEFPGIGHAPALLAEDQIETVCRWLLQ